MEQQPQILLKTFRGSAIEGMEIYRSASRALRRKLGFFGKAMTKEEKKLFYEEERKIWLAIFAPQKLKDEYGITLSQSYDCDAVDKIVKEIANGIVEEVISPKLLTH